jgi:hypothetical protein
MHALAEHVLAPARHAENGKIGLRYTHRGFGTPFFGADHQVRVEGQHLIVHDARAPITTLRAAARHAGVPPGVPTEVFTPTTTPTLDEVLAVDAPSAHALGEWYGFCASVLEQLREEATPQDSPARVQLWPENYGGSPGDAEHPEPYLYVGPWSPSATDCYWNEPFGATLGYRQLLEADDQREAALAFLRHGKELLQTRPS